MHSPRQRFGLPGLAFCLFALLGCGGHGQAGQRDAAGLDDASSEGDAATDGPADDASHQDADVSAPWQCPTWGTRTTVGSIANLDILEASGLAASKKNSGIYWTHNDSGDTERFFALGADGSNRGTFVVSTSQQNDWEDIAVGPGPAVGETYVYLASIGGNSPRNAVYLLRVPEPTVSSDAAPGNHPVANTVRIDFKYPGSESYDAETLLVDPRQGDVYIVTKHGASGTAKVFFAAAPFNDAQPRTLELVHTIQFPTGGNNNVGATTGGDMSPDGAEAVIRTYDVIWLWHRADGVTWADAFKTEPCIVDTGILTKGVEPQGEAIAFAANGKDLRITTELGWNASAKEPILAYPRQ